MKKTFKNIWRAIYPVLIFFAVSILVSVIATTVVQSRIMMNDGLMDDYFNGDLTDEQLAEMITVEFNKNMVLYTLIADAAAIPFAVLFIALDKRKNRRLRYAAANRGRIEASMPPVAPEYRKFALDYYTAQAAKSASRTELKRYAEPRGGMSFLAYLLLIPMAVGAALAMNNFVSLLGLPISDTYDDAFLAIEQTPILLQVICVVLVGPVAEELFFRGLVYKRMTKMMPVWLAMILSAVMFGAYHFNLQQGVYAMLLGIIMAYVYEKTKNLLAPIIFHVVANGFVTLVTWKPLAPYFNNYYTDFFIFLLFSLAALLALVCGIAGFEAMSRMSDTAERPAWR